ncbi:MAG: hypothetical protein QM727_07120 [Niabella sp.]
MKTKAVVILLMVALLSTGCYRKFGGVKTSMFVLQNPEPGWSKDEVIHRYGQPYKMAFRYEADSTLHETLYYKEWVRYTELKSLLHFTNDKLTGLEAGSEKPFFATTDTIVVSR